MRLYNTLSGKKEPLPKPPKGKPLRLFVCGPTVYDESHIGHARTYLVFDALVQYLKSRGVNVKYVQNITDIDDKIIACAREIGTTPAKLAKKYTAAYTHNMKSLGVSNVIHAPATKFIREIIRQVMTLMGKGYAYEIPGDGIYFDVTKSKDYGKLARRTALQAEDATSRIDESIKKRNRGDFALWKLSHASSAPPRKRPGNANAPMRMISDEPSWWSPFGWGRPGWHIEDTAISGHYFGPRYELHGGGVDLKFPHHEAEIAQAEAASGRKPFVKIWMHVGTLLVRGKKMSKSLRNYISIDDFLSRHAAEVLRFFVLMHHYRQPLNYTEGLASEMRVSLENLKMFLGKLVLVKQQSTPVKQHTNILKYVGMFERKFYKALADDFNTPEALAAVFKLINRAQLKLWQLSKAEAKLLSRHIIARFKTLGFALSLPKIPRTIAVLVQKREEFRRNKQFVQSDALRKKINVLGYVIEDTPLGPFLWPREK